MKIPYRTFHLLQLLEGYEQQNAPLDLFINDYFRSNKALGPKDRGFIAETTYTLVRWNGLLEYLCEGNPSWEQKIEILQNADLKSLSQDQTIPPHLRVSFPETLYRLFVENFGEQRASELCIICNQAAPTTIRVNTAKTSREHLLQRWKNIYSISPCQHAKNGIVFHKKIAFFTLPEFKEGLFEVQDEASQLVAEMVEAQPGQQVLDFCSGSGGKTLAFAPQMKGKGQIYLHDVRPYALQEAQKRLKRAGIQNAQVVLADDPKLKKLKKNMDWVLVDAPCSGTGTLRRNPDMKWRFTEEMLQRLCGQQRTIFEKALSFLKPGGRIVYATCSILKEENEKQIEHFLRTYSLIQDNSLFQSYPTVGGMDGFFAFIFKPQ